ncbi:hypothetical protein RJ641_035270 [Dillenia turbinata]|uniref:Polycomb protein VEFS-Box domain-containing protein n=1 Tax=Dillenia turbinata TaxID=194707 RepID=A0AAN8ZI32_9MAGN
MCHQNSCEHLSAEESIAAEESLLVYCKPVELYNILQRRNQQNPSFLQRCLQYKVKARRSKRLKMTISLSGTANNRIQTQNLTPYYIFLARPISDIGALRQQQSTVYSLRQAYKMILIESEGRIRAETNFIVPEINKLWLNVKAGKLTILIVNFDETKDPPYEVNSGGYCLCGKVPLESLVVSLKRSVSLTLGHRAEMVTNIDTWACFLEPCSSGKDGCLTFQILHNSKTMVSSQQLQALIAAQEVGVKEGSPYDSRTCHVPPSSFSNGMRLRAGNVVFNYRDYNNMLRKTEVTEEFSCPFCLMQCASFKGLRYHLCSSHDLFNYEFWVTEEYQAVNVSVNIDNLRSEMAADEVDFRLDTFFFSKPRKRRRPNPPQNTGNVYPLLLEPQLSTLAREGICTGFLEKDDGEEALNSFLSDKDLQSTRRGTKNRTNYDPTNTECIEHIGSSFNVTGAAIAMAQSSLEPECVQSAFESDPSPSMPHFAKSRKSSFERPDTKSQSLLLRRQFFHSHRAQVTCDLTFGFAFICSVLSPFVFLMVVIV